MEHRNDGERPPEVKTPLWSVSLPRKPTPVSFFVIVAVGLLGVIGFAIDHAAQQAWVWAPFGLLCYLIRTFADLVRTHGEVLIGDPRGHDSASVTGKRAHRPFPKTAKVEPSARVAPARLPRRPLHPGLP